MQSVIQETELVQIVFYQEHWIVFSLADENKCNFWLRVLRYIAKVLGYFFCGCAVASLYICAASAAAAAAADDDDDDDDDDEDDDDDDDDG